MTQWLVRKTIEENGSTLYTKRKALMVEHLGYQDTEIHAFLYGNWFSNARRGNRLGQMDSFLMHIP